MPVSHYRISSIIRYAFHKNIPPCNLKSKLNQRHIKCLCSLLPPTGDKYNRMNPQFPCLRNDFLTHILTQFLNRKQQKPWLFSIFERIQKVGFIVFQSSNKQNWFHDLQELLYVKQMYTFYSDCCFPGKCLLKNGEQEKGCIYPTCNTP